MHSEFSSIQTKKNEKDIQIIKSYIARKCKISNLGKLFHMITGVQVHDEEADNWLKCIERGKKHYLRYRESRIIDKSKSLFDTTFLAVITPVLSKPAIVGVIFQKFTVKLS